MKIGEYNEYMRRILEPAFFEKSAQIVGKKLLGTFIVCIVSGKEIALPITEVEIYDGFEDRASHAFRGKTERNMVMFGNAGHLYVYFVYGMHWMLNVVIGKKEYPAAVLIRSAGEYNGPGKLTKALGISRIHNGKLATPATGLWFEDRGYFTGAQRKKFHIRCLPRVGIPYAGATWANKLFRFVLEKKSVNKSKKIDLRTIDAQVSVCSSDQY